MPEHLVHSTLHYCADTLGEGTPLEHHEQRYFHRTTILSLTGTTTAGFARPFHESRGKIHTPHRCCRASILTILVCCVHCCGPAPFRERILHIIHSPALWSIGVAFTILFTPTYFGRERLWNRWAPFTTGIARHSNVPSHE